MSKITVKSFWFDDIDEAEEAWTKFLQNGWSKYERLKIKFNWKYCRTMYRFKVSKPTDILEKEIKSENKLQNKGK